MSNHHPLSDDSYADASMMDRIALRLDDVCAWSEASKVLNHSGWVDVLETIKRISPDAYHELKRWINEGGKDV